MRAEFKALPRWLETAEAGQLPGATGSPPLAAPGDGDAPHTTPIWPGVSQELSPTAGAQKRGGQTTASGSDGQKIDHSKASFDLCLTHLQNPLFQKIPRESTALASSFEVLARRFSL